MDELEDVITSLNSRLESAADEVQERQRRVLRAISTLAEETQTVRERVEQGKDLNPKFLQEAHQDVVREVRALASLLEDYAVDYKSRKSLADDPTPPYAEGSTEQ